MIRKVKFVSERPPCSMESEDEWSTLAGFEVEVFNDEVEERFVCEGRKFRLTGTSKSAIYARTGKHHHRPFLDSAVCEHEICEVTA